MRHTLLLVAALACVPAATAQAILPVTMHVLTYDDGSGDVSDDLLAEQVDLLNALYVPTGYQFELVSVTRTANSEWADFGYDDDFAAVGSALAIDPATRINIYYYPNTTDGAIGSTVEPERWAPSDTRNGVFVDQGTLPGGQYEDYNDGTFLGTMTGIYLGVRFILFGCSFNDQVEDTPSYATLVFGCPSDPAELDVCAGGDAPPEVLLDNAMRAGALDGCRDTFTPGQIAFLDSQIATHWPDLGTPVSAEGGPRSTPLSLSAWPNPVLGDRAMVTLEGARIPGQAQLVDLSGRVVWTREIAPGEDAFEVDTAALPAGTYALTARVDGLVTTRLVTVIR